MSTLSELGTVGEVRESRVDPESTPAQDVPSAFAITRGSQSISVHAISAESKRRVLLTLQATSQELELEHHYLTRPAPQLRYRE